MLLYAFSRCKVQCHLQCAVIVSNFMTDSDSRMKHFSSLMLSAVKFFNTQHSSPRGGGDKSIILKMSF